MALGSQVAVTGGNGSDNHLANGKCFLLILRVAVFDSLDQRNHR